MAEPVNTGMPKAEMRKLLTRSKEEPVSCAIGLGDDQAYGLLMMHRIKNGKACEKILKDTFPSAKNTRFGTAFVDVDDNPKLVKIILNRAVTGMAKRLTRTLKGTGFNKVIIVPEDGSTVEAHEDVEDGAPEGAEAGAPAPGAPPPPPPRPAAGMTPEEKAAKISELQQALATFAAMIPKAAGTDDARKATLLKLATDVNVNIKTGNLACATNFLDQLRIALAATPAPQASIPQPLPRPAASMSPEEKAAKIAELQHTLTTFAAMIPAAAGADNAKKAILLKLATDANVNIKTGNLTYATNFLDQLRIALSAKPDPATLQVLTGSRQAWTGTQQKVKAEVEKLRGELARTFQGEPFAAEITAKFDTKVMPIVEKFDDRLLDILDDAMNVPDGPEREALIVQSKAVMKDYLTFAMTEQLINDFDGNPFVPLAIRATVTTTLAALAKAVH